MKVTGPGRVGPTTGGKSTRKADAAPGFADLLKTGGAGGTPPVAPTAGPAAVDALLALQEVPDSTQRRSAGLKRGRMLLDGLDELRHGLLAGNIAPARVQALLQSVRAERLEVDDPGLKAVLDEIELRAQVELAKMSRYA
jgi:hypothetical protein